MKNSPDFSKMIITRIVSAARLYNSPMQSAAERHDREHWGLVLKRTGRTVYRLNGEEWSSDALHPALLPKGSSYSWKCLEAGECLIIEFDCAQTGDTPFSFSINDNSLLVRTFLRIEKRRLRKDSLHDIKNIRDLYDLLLFLAESDSSGYLPSAKYEIIRPAIDYMVEHYPDPDINNDTLAALCEISTVYFRKIFRQLRNASPMQQLHMIRMRQAAELLKGDYSSVAQVAESVGYNSLYHFSKMFKRYYGIAPSKYQRDAKP